MRSEGEGVAMGKGKVRCDGEAVHRVVMCEDEGVKGRKMGEGKR